LETAGFTARAFFVAFVFGDFFDGAIYESWRTRGSDDKGCRDVWGPSS
jgi:hypothetical protein